MRAKLEMCLPISVLPVKLIKSMPSVRNDVIPDLTAAPSYGIEYTAG